LKIWQTIDHAVSYSLSCVPTSYYYLVYHWKHRKDTAYRKNSSVKVFPVFLWNPRANFHWSATFDFLGSTAVVISIRICTGFGKLWLTVTSRISNGNRITCDIIFSSISGNLSSVYGDCSSIGLVIFYAARSEHIFVYTDRKKIVFTIIII